MATFTRRELRTPQTNDANFTSAKNFSLVNNATTTAYFNIEGVSGYDVFNSASCTSLVNCTVITESAQGAFIINPNSTATFTFTPGSGNTIVKENVRFVASNALVFSNADPTASGSAVGVNLNTNA